MAKSKPRDKRLDVAKEMPPLCRSPRGKENYSYKTDAVFQWLSQRPGMISYLFDLLSRTGYIVYDSKSNTWQGVDYDGT